ncbi:hypothetical protein X768_25575 [Mesorhizobium sp. LSJC265A00]|nr:hypothetical protein X768_25575 [Mesorhizobium sp. LSJC265A00]ESY65956.1 hypothetical protein X742_20645 [Mesorhizobium sp. LNHC232B00]ESZ21354.1 hypothetical protein X734_30470 [Mesorhizobium sp. L2C084A000]
MMALHSVAMEGRKVTGGRCGSEDLRRHVDDVVRRQTDYQDRLTRNCLGTSRGEMQNIILYLRGQDKVRVVGL